MSQHISYSERAHSRSYKKTCAIFLLWVASFYKYIFLYKSSSTSLNMGLHLFYLICESSIHKTIIITMKFISKTKQETCFMKYELQDLWLLCCRVIIHFSRTLGPEDILDPMWVGTFEEKPFLKEFILLWTQKYYNTNNQIIMEKKHKFQLFFFESYTNIKSVALQVHLSYIFGSFCGLSTELYEWHTHTFHAVCTCSSISSQRIHLLPVNMAMNRNWSWCTPYRD